MKIKHETLTERIHLLVFDTQLDLTSTFLRFQEHYESPKFRGKIFSLDTFKRWYIQNSPEGKKKKEFTYYTDWNGFNIPSYILKPFYSGKFDPISKQERQFLEIFKDEPEPFYIIGIHKEIKNLSAFIKHEIAHGLFYTDKTYKSEVLAVLSRFDIEPLKAELRSKAGYHERVLEDECHAYSIDSIKKLKTPVPKELSNKLKQIYRKYLKKNEIHLSLSSTIVKI
jgi:hypothetical protein